MKVAQINAYNFGSTGNIMLGIAEISRGRGIEAYTFSSSRKALPAQKGHILFDNKLDYTLHMGMGVYFGRETDFSYLATKRLIRKLKKIDPDIIHLHNTHGYYLNHPLFFKYLKKSGKKVVWTLHDCWGFTGRCPHFTLTACEKWKTACENCPYDKKMYPASRLADRSRQEHKRKKRLFSGLDLMIVTPSAWLSDLVRQSHLGAYPVKVINNGIDLGLFSPISSDFRKKHGLEDKKVVLGVAMAWNERKGFDVMIKLAESLADYAVVLVGHIPEDASLPENVIHIPNTRNQKELVEIYSIADVFANPTKEDNFPTVNLEALASGTPVVTFRTGGSPESVDELSGSVVDYGDSDAFIQEVKRVCEETPYTRENCRKRAENFDMKKKFLEYVNLYEKIVKN